MHIYNMCTYMYQLFYYIYYSLSIYIILEIYIYIYKIRKKRIHSKKK